MRFCSSVETLSVSYSSNYENVTDVDIIHLHRVKCENHKNLVRAVKYALHKGFTFIRRFVKCDRVFLSTGIRTYTYYVLHSVLDTISTSRCYIFAKCNSRFYDYYSVCFVTFRSVDKRICKLLSVAKIRINKILLLVNVPQ